MRYKALVSFCGRISMTIGEERELSESGDVKSLVKAGYIQAMHNGRLTMDNEKAAQRRKPAKQEAASPAADD